MPLSLFVESLKLPNNGLNIKRFEHIDNRVGFRFQLFKIPRLKS